jgi:hypothetical protein
MEEARQAATAWVDDTSEGDPLRLELSASWAERFGLGAVG